MRNEIFIHVGAGKTGTSALQGFFHLNHSELQRAGLTVPKIGVDKSENTLAHHLLCGAGRFAEFDPFPLWKEIAKLDDSKILVSSEILHSRISHSDGIAFYSQVKDILEGFDIKIIFYIRREDQWIQSAYEQWVKTGELRSGETVDELADRFNRSQPSQIRKFAEIFGEEAIIVRPYEKCQLKNGDIIDDFLTTVKIPFDPNFKRPAKNPNPPLSREVLDFKLVFNTICDSRNEAQLINRDMNELSSNFYGVRSESFIHRRALSEKKCREIIEAQIPEYEWIARNLMNRKDGVLFKELDPVTDKEKSSRGGRDEGKESKKILMFLIKKLYKRNQALARRISELEKNV